jgi:Glycosyl hydrolases family 16
LPSGTLDGGEVRHRRPRGDGHFRARLQASAAPGSLSAFFLYLHDFDTDSSDELDVELPAGEPHRALLTVWRRGGHEPADQRIVELDFDPSAALHAYEIVREPGGTVHLAIDGATAFTSRVAPAARLHLMFNAWYPDWLAGRAVTGRFHACRPVRIRTAWIAATFFSHGGCRGGQTA